MFLMKFSSKHKASGKKYLLGKCSLKKELIIRLTVLEETLKLEAISFSEIFFCNSRVIANLISLEIQQNLLTKVVSAMKDLEQFLQRNLCFFNLKRGLKAAIFKSLILEILYPHLIIFLL